MQKFKNIKLKTIIRPLAMILSIAVLLVYGTYSWVRRQWTPTIEQSGIKIATGDSLSFMFDDSVSGFQTSLNALLGMENFVLKSVSNATGESDHFFTLEPDAKGVGYERYSHINKDKLINGTEGYTQSQIYMELGKQYGYVEITFKIYSPEGNADRYVYIDTTGNEEKLPSHISNSASSADIADGEPNPEYAIRVSMTWDEDGEEKTVIFANDGRVDAKDSEGNIMLHKAVTNEIIEGHGTYGYIADTELRCEMDENNEVRRDENGDPIERENFTITLSDGPSEKDAFRETTLQKLSAYNGETEESCLFALGAGQFKEVTVRVWLEGVDKNCVNSIAGRELDLLLRFASKTFSEETEETTDPAATTTPVTTTAPVATTATATEPPETTDPEETTVATTETPAA